MDLRTVLERSLLRHPGMEPGDLLRLIYENEFGPGTEAPTVDAALSEIRAELPKNEYEEDAPLYEEIGNGFLRVYLSGMDPYDYPAEHLAADYVASFADVHGSEEGFYKKLYWVQAHADEFAFDFSEEELSEAVEAYLVETAKNGFKPPKSDLDEEEQAAPAYRVISGRFVRDFAKEIEQKASTPRRFMKRAVWILVTLVVFAALIALGAVLYDKFVY